MSVLKFTSSADIQPASYLSLSGLWGSQGEVQGCLKCIWDPPCMGHGVWEVSLSSTWMTSGGASAAADDITLCSSAAIFAIIVCLSCRQACSHLILA